MRLRHSRSALRNTAGVGSRDGLKVPAPS